MNHNEVIRALTSYSTEKVDTLSDEELIYFAELIENLDWALNCAFQRRGL